MRNAKKRTKIEIEYDYENIKAIIREVFVDSGRVFRRYPALTSFDTESLEGQVKGFTDAIKASRSNP